MIKNLEIKNFKSIKKLNINCMRINLFIGEPNTGKSNILESLGILSFLKYGFIRDFVRMEGMSDLFYDENLDEVVSVIADNKELDIAFNGEKFLGECYDREQDGATTANFSFEYDYAGSGGSSFGREAHPIKFYKFSQIKNSQGWGADFLKPPFGENLFTVLTTHKKLRDEAIQIFEPFGLKLVFRLKERKIEIMKQRDDFIITYPYSLASDTLQRIVFYATAINSNKDSILVLEEPESNTFPYYTKLLGEKIAFDERNQYFIATHNPYLLLAILEKAEKKSVNVFATYLKDYQTKTRRLNDEQISELMNHDPFFNLDAFIGEDVQ